MTGRQIIKAVMEKRRIGPKDFFGANRTQHAVRARADAIRQMGGLGMSKAAIARVMMCSTSTVQYWLRPEYRRRHKELSYQRQAEMRAA